MEAEMWSGMMLVCMYIVFHSCTCYADIISIIHYIDFSVIPSNITDKSNN